MSWIRDHFHRFVFPAMMVAGRDTKDIGPPMDVVPSASAPQNWPTELRKDVPWSSDVKEGGLGSSAYRQSAKIHHTILRNTLSSAVVAMKEEKCSKLLFAGRDVWVLAVLAERKGIPYIFIPEISRRVAGYQASLLKLLEERGVTGDELLIDTGFAGSIPRAMSYAMGKHMTFRLMSQSEIMWAPCKLGTKRVRKDFVPQQLFPNRKAARSEALETEYLAKYWKTGTVVPITTGFVPPQPEHLDVSIEFMKKCPQRVVQFFSERATIQRAAIVTSMLYRGIPQLPPPR
jgi:hypothetical protein